MKQISLKTGPASPHHLFRIYPLSMNDAQMAEIHENAPVAIFGFNRPRHLERCLKSLEVNKEAARTDIFIFIDGPRSQDDVRLVSETRKIARRTYRFKTVTVVEQEFNLGLGTSITNGISYVLKLRDRLIVLEDDLTVSRYFLSYMNQGLNIYKDNGVVGSIHGYNFSFEKPLSEPYFIRGGDCLGWATWADRWNLFSKDSASTYSKLKRLNLIKAFDLDGSFRYSNILKNEIRDGFHSWAINWHASLFSNGRLTLYPGLSLVEYNGADGSGTHPIKNSTLWDTKLSEKMAWDFPDRIVESKDGFEQLKKYYEKTYPSRNPLLGLTNWIRYKFLS